MNDEHEACIADFGLSRILETEGFTTKSVGGTCRWMAYELIAPSEEEEEESVPQVTVATDIWAFGMTALEVRPQLPHHACQSNTLLFLFQIFTGKLPFWHIKYDTAVILSVMRGGRPKHETYPTIGRSIWSMLERCWHADPAQRPSMESLTRHHAFRPAKAAFRLRYSFYNKRPDGLSFQSRTADDKPSRPVFGQRDLNSSSAPPFSRRL